MDERARILKMVAEGTVTPKQAEQLLNALDVRKETESAPILPLEDYDRKILYIVVDSKDGDKINVQFPVGGIKKIIRATGKIPLAVDGMEGLNMEELMDAVAECLDSRVVGDFITVDSADGDKVRLYVE